MLLRSVALRANVAAISSDVPCFPMGLGSRLLMKRSRGESIRRSNSLVLAKVFRIWCVMRDAISRWRRTDETDGRRRIKNDDVTI